MTHHRSLLVCTSQASIQRPSYTLGLNLLQMLNNLIWSLACQIIDDVLTLTILRADQLALCQSLPPSTPSAGIQFSMQGL